MKYLVKNTVKKFSCLHCGASFNSYPPDDIRNMASLRITDVNEPIKIKYRCEKCNYENIIYWGRRK